MKKYYAQPPLESFYDQAVSWLWSGFGACCCLRGRPHVGMSSTAQLETSVRETILLGKKHTMTKRILLLAAVFGVGMLAQPSLYAQEKKAAASPSPAAATTETKTSAKKSTGKHTHSTKKAVKKAPKTAS
jgi:hypothetical protein